jgi:hypothetical protein
MSLNNWELSLALIQKRLDALVEQGASTDVLWAVEKSEVEAVNALSPGFVEFWCDHAAVVRDDDEGPGEDSVRTDTGW